ncbi:MAG: SHOCT domain-containing protein [Actinobacteria bacterium]|nr:SHOCT domain-containing protein [Actinomycetota bacterium]
MECVCGCGRDVPKKQVQRNFTAATLYAIHEEGGGDPDEDCEEWLVESAQMRLQRPEMNKKTFLALGRRTGTPVLSDADMEHLDRKHPERSFTGLLEAAPATATAGPPPRTAPTTGPTAQDDDLVGKLERLRALRDDGTLSEDEFATAKARLLG